MLLLIFKASKKDISRPKLTSATPGRQPPKPAPRATSPQNRMYKYKSMSTTMSTATSNSNWGLVTLLSDLKNQTIVSSCVTHILPSCGYFKGQEQICFNPTSWHLVTYNFLRGHKF